MCLCLQGAIWGFVLGIYFAITGDSSHTSARPANSQQTHQLERQSDTVHTAAAPAQRAAAPLQQHSKVHVADLQQSGDVVCHALRCI
jgi:hypothetical protein